MVSIARDFLEKTFPTTSRGFEIEGFLASKSDRRDFALS
jgi:hypothetical protein